MPYDHLIEEIQKLIDNRPLGDEFELDQLFAHGWPEGINANQHNAFGRWFRTAVADGRILRVDDIDLPLGQAHTVCYRRVEVGGQNAVLRLVLPSELWGRVDAACGEIEPRPNREQFIRRLIEAAVAHVP